MGLHRDALLGDTHYAHAWAYANAAARTGATGFVATDVGKLALQLDTSALYILTATTPTWVSVGVTGGTAAESNTAAGWTGSNPTLGVGVFGYETDTTKFKIGTGALAWNDLSYWKFVPEHITVNTTGGDTTLSVAQNKATSINVAGALVANVNIIVNNTMAVFVAENNTTGAYTVTFKTAAGTGVAVPQGEHITLYADGVNVENPVTAGAGSGDVVGPGSAVNLNIATYSGTTGKLIADGGKAISELELVSNKATGFGTVNDTLYPTVQAVKTYADGLVVGLLDDRGNYDASVNTFPASGGSGTAGAIMKGDLWYISVAGTLGGTAVHIGDTVRALADTPGQTASNWDILLDARTAAADITVTTRTVGSSTNLDTALGNLDSAIVDFLDTGFAEWTVDAAPFYSVTANKVKVLQAGYGRIAGKKVEWAINTESVEALTAGSAHWVYVDINGAVHTTTARTHALYAANIILFEAYWDGVAAPIVVFENHSVHHDSDAQEFAHEVVGTVLTPAENTNVIGADIYRKTPLPGAIAGTAADRQIYLLGDADINDGGLETALVGSATPITIGFFWKRTASDNFWILDSTGTEFPIKYSTGAALTTLTGSPTSDFALWTVYAGKGLANGTGTQANAVPYYFAVADTAEVATSADALARVTAGTNKTVDTTLFNAMEPAQLGHVVVTSDSTTYIASINIAKDTLRAQQSGGVGASIASAITTSVANFSGLLGASDTTVQAALETLDETERQSSSIASATTTDLATATGGYVHITGGVTITGFGTHVAGNLMHLVFDGAPLITHNATSLILPGGANIQTSAGDTMVLRSEGDGTGTGSSGTYWRCVAYQTASTTGTGALVRADTPTLITPILGVATATTINGCTLTSGTLNGSVTGTNTGDQSRASLGLDTTDSPMFTGINLGHASDTTITRAGAGVIAVEGNNVLLTSGALGTPSSGTLTNCTGLPIDGITDDTTSALGLGSIELGHASDTTVTRSAAGVIAVEGVAVPTISSTHTLTNKRVSPRVGSTTSHATPTINTDNYDIYQLTAQAEAITSFTTNLSGTPVEGQGLIIEVTGTAARAITWGASFESSTVTLPTTTVTTAKLTVGFLYNAVTSKWRCVASV